MQKEQIKNILKDCFWEYNFNENDIISLAKSKERQEQIFLFTKPSFNHEYMARRINIVEYYFLDKPLTINELKWVA